jgi:peptide-methionine (S)-S-oxide reductase
MGNKWFMSIVSVLGSIFLVFAHAGAEENKTVSVEGGIKVKTELRTATLGGGCFWCMEAVFQRIVGVESVESGYAGGTIANPTYQDVSRGNSGHAEVIRIQFDTTQVSYKELLEIFVHSHNPTTLNKQGADEGTQYRSVIFYDGEEQKRDADAVIKEITEKKLWDDPIVTEVSPLSGYTKAEAYHQNYYNQNQSQPYCSIVIAPKLKKIYKEFAGRLKPVK